eukprot:3186169-Prymnesium_polylepis.1
MLLVWVARRGVGACCPPPQRDRSASSRHCDSKRKSAGVRTQRRAEGGSGGRLARGAVDARSGVHGGHRARGCLRRCQRHRSRHRGKRWKRISLRVA